MKKDNSYNIKFFDYPGDKPDISGNYLCYFGNGVWGLGIYLVRDDLWMNFSEKKMMFNPKCWGKLPDMRCYDTIVRLPDGRTFVQAQRDYKKKG
jgi:hypothetical protein